MGEETLVTFLFDCPAAARTVELLGSWDNFTKTYPLTCDRRRGRTIWSGCYTFDHIICDGDFKNTNGPRSGALKMGGTYWYYYKIDGEEFHNPSEPSTTLCPLLPGQRLNVLEVPRETRSRSNSELSIAMTRNPKDKFLTPVPPNTQKPLPSPRLGNLCTESYTVPMQQPVTPKSATYPSAGPLLSPGPRRHARSASTSPQVTTTPLFSDLRALKEKFTQKTSLPCRQHARSQSNRELEISAPTLISTTAEDIDLIPLSALQPPPTVSTYRAPPTSASLPSPIRAKQREFSPLGSNPVDPVTDLQMPPRRIAMPMRHISESGRPRSRSNPPGPTIPKHEVVRANSSEMRRTKLFSNQPWATSPKHSKFASDEQLPEVVPAPVLQRPSNLGLPPSDARPTSSHGGDRSSSLQKIPVDTGKKLPALPRFLVPAPLYACNSEARSPTKTEFSPAQQLDAIVNKEDEVKEIVPVQPAILTGKNSHFSLWSEGSFASSSPTSDDDAHSPTFSSLTSNSSDFGSPRQLSMDGYDPSSHARSNFNSTSLSAHPPLPPSHRTSAASILSEIQSEVDATSAQFSPTSSPQLELQDLRLSAFGPGMFLDIQRAESAPRRQAACFGYGSFQGYKLPEDETTSKTTITEESYLRNVDSEQGLGIRHGQERENSQLDRLVNDFGFLGEAVL